MADAQKHLVFVWKSSGYELRERAGEAPARGTEVEDGDSRYVVTRVGSSPLPGDERSCAYLQPVSI